MRVMGLDYGSTSLGVAVGNTELGSAEAVAVVPVRAEIPDWPKLDALMREWSPRQVIVGMPYPHQPGHSRTVLTRAKKLRERIEERYAIRCSVVDELLSSDEARRRAREIGRPGGERVDDIAAQIILETWMNG
ncbi:MAG: Holliday junction resolvase RuvX [Gammaproteobacteria bacterium AqS3]|nr:Holliday junction resolvase RuvX [Gammaproteobacteria bacterium AqS3]